MSSLQRLTSLHAQRAVANAAGVQRRQRVRHGVRDQILVMVFSAALSLVLAVLLSLLVAHLGGVAKP